MRKSMWIYAIVFLTGIPAFAIDPFASNLKETSPRPSRVLPAEFTVSSSNAVAGTCDRNDDYCADVRCDTCDDACCDICDDSCCELARDCCRDTWTGCYIGFNIGAAINDSDYALRPTGEWFDFPLFVPQITRSGDLSGESLLLGGQVGYDFQIAPSWVVGVESDFNWSQGSETNRDSTPLAPPFGVGNFVEQVNQEVKWFGTLRGRAGYAQGNWMAFVTGGLAYGNIESTSDIVFTFDGSRFTGMHSTTNVGWTAGAGLECKLSRNWSAKMEYLYIDLGEVNYTSTNVPPPAFPTFTFRTDLQTQFHVVRMGLNYRF